jgi:hypothetical protein
MIVNATRPMPLTPLTVSILTTRLNGAAGTGNHGKSLTIINGLRSSNVLGA